MIRLATTADVPSLVDLGASFLASTPYGALLPTNVDQIAALMTHLIESPDGDVFVSTDRAGVLTGMLGALCFTHLLSGEWIASELFWWVEPAWRGAGVRLLAAVETWARAHGAVKFQMIAPMDSGVGRLYVRRGYVPVEVAYQRDLREVA